MTTGGWFLIALLVAFIAVIVYMNTGYQNSNARAVQQRKSAALMRDHELQHQGLEQNESGPPSCPKCGGTQFKLRRSPTRRAGIATAGALTGGVGALAAAGKQKVQCVTCGLFFDTL